MFQSQYGTLHLSIHHQLDPSKLDAADLATARSQGRVVPSCSIVEAFRAIRALEESDLDSHSPASSPSPDSTVTDGKSKADEKESETKSRRSSREEQKPAPAESSVAEVKKAAAQWEKRLSTSEVPQSSFPPASSSSRLSHMRSQSGGPVLTGGSARLASLLRQQQLQQQQRAQTDEDTKEGDNGEGKGGCILC